MTLNHEVNDVEDGVEPGQQGPPSATDEFGSGREAEDDAARNEVDSVEEKPVISRDENVTVESVLGDDDSDVRSIDLELVGSHRAPAAESARPVSCLPDGAADTGGVC